LRNRDPTSQSSPDICLIALSEASLQSPLGSATQAVLAVVAKIVLKVDHMIVLRLPVVSITHVDIAKSIFRFGEKA
jgi:hypothetical protein